VKGRMNKMPPLILAGLWYWHVPTDASFIVSAQKRQHGICQHF